MLYILLISILVILDQVTKYIVVDRFYYGETLPIINGFFHLTYVKNQGIAFGMFQDKLHIISWLTLIAVVLLGIYLIKHLKKSPMIEKIAYIFIFSGAIGNLIDRVFRGFVVDMIDFRGIWVFVFNFADVWISLGLILIIIDSFIRRNKE